MTHPAPPAEGSSRRFFLLRALVTLLSLGLLVYLVHSTQGWGELVSLLRRLPWYSLALALVFILLSRVCITLRWLVLLRYAGARIGFWQALRLMFMGLFASNFLPSTVGGDLVRLAGAVSLGVDASVSAASLVVDRLIGMAGMASLGPYGLYLLAKQPSAASLLTALPAMGLFPGAFQRLRRVPLVGWALRKLESIARRLAASALAWVRRPGSLVLALAFTYGHMLFTFLIIWVLLRAMNQPLSLLWIGALWSLSYFVALVPISINGLGLQEMSITVLYSQFGGVSMEAAVALALLMRMIFLIASLPGVLFLPEILRPVKKSGLAKSQPTNQI